MPASLISKAISFAVALSASPYVAIASIFVLKYTDCPLIIAENGILPNTMLSGKSGPLDSITVGVFIIKALTKCCSEVSFIMSTTSCKEAVGSPVALTKVRFTLFTCIILPSIASIFETVAIV